MIMDKETRGKLCRLSMGHLYASMSIEQLEKINHETVTHLKDIRFKIGSAYYDIFNNLPLKDREEIVSLGFYPKS
jgi:predicted sulfurtransferase